MKGILKTSGCSGCKNYKDCELREDLERLATEYFDKIDLISLDCEEFESTEGCPECVFDHSCPYYSDKKARDAQPKGCTLEPARATPKDATCYDVVKHLGPQGGR